MKKKSVYQYYLYCSHTESMVFTTECHLSDLQKTARNQAKDMGVWPCKIFYRLGGHVHFDPLDI